MIKLNFLKLFMLVLLGTLSFSNVSNSITLDTKSLLKKKDSDTNADNGGKFDFKNANTDLVKTFFVSANNYMQAQEFLLIAYGKNTEAAQVKEAIAYAKDAGVDDAKKMKNSIKIEKIRNKF